MEPTAPAFVPVDDDGYTGAPVLGAVLGTIFFPLLAFIAALVLQGAETNPRKKSQLRSWAWISGAWLAVGLLIFILALVAFGVFAGTVVNHVRTGTRIPASNSTPCRGGLKSVATRNIPGTDKYVFPCTLGGTTTVVIAIPSH